MNDLTTSDCGTKSLPGNVCSRCPHMSKPPTLNAKSILPYTGNNELRCYEAKIEEVKRPQPPGVEPRTPPVWATSALPLSNDNHQPSQFSLCTIYLLLLFLAVSRTKVGEPGCQWTAHKTGSAPEPHQQTQSVQPGEMELVHRVSLHCRHPWDSDNVSGFTCLWYCLMIWSAGLFNIPNYPTVLLSSFLFLFLFPSPPPGWSSCPEHHSRRPRWCGVWGRRHPTSFDPLCC